MEQIKVVSAAQMAQAEAQSVSDGANGAEYMKAAGRALFHLIEETIEQKELDKRVVLLIGKGNNGGDAYTAGTILLKEKYDVRIYHLFDDKEVSELNLYHKKKCIKHGAEIIQITSADELVFHPTELVIDGLVGTGFSGKLEGLYAEVIRKVNQSHVVVLSIDIPAGVNGDNGRVEGEAIHASVTGYLGQPKIGFFINQGFDRVGALHQLDFGLDRSYVDSMESMAYLVDHHTFAYELPKYKRTRHKYEAGYVLAFAGSPSMPGAASLSTLAALRAGAGIVRLYTPKNTHLYHLAPEVIHSEWMTDNFASLNSELSRAKSLYIGPGLGREIEARKLLDYILQNFAKPIVLDADAIFHLRDRDLSQFDHPLVLTPHRKECMYLLGIEQKIEDLKLFAQIQEYVEKNRVVLVLKGAPTVIFRPHEKPSIVVSGDPAMATAGSGDVLTGVIAALLAQGIEPYMASALGTTIHGLSGEIASGEKTVFSVIASDLIEYLHEAIFHLLGPSHNT
ncbi:MAG: NAD(P)H-hydrate dehydratase [Rhabdochlamydiaceae bacterium]|nr:NAD(P)H-hydrate dehydratase [Candidatus Amphrikana amoebophyrae]